MPLSKECALWLGASVALLSVLCDLIDLLTQGDTPMDFSKLDGLIPAVVQDETTSEVLMVGFMNDEAWRLTQESGFVTFFSRSRNKLWMKGETSGNRLAVKQMFVDCDEDTVLIKVERQGDGNVCHTGARSCFYTPAFARPEASELRRGPSPNDVEKDRT